MLGRIAQCMRFAARSLKVVILRTAAGQARALSSYVVLFRFTLKVEIRGAVFRLRIGG